MCGLRERGRRKEEEVVGVCERERERKEEAVAGVYVREREEGGGGGWCVAGCVGEVCICACVRDREGERGRRVGHHCVS